MTRRQIKNRLRRIVSDAREAGFAIVADLSGDPALLVVPLADCDQDDLTGLDKSESVEIAAGFGVGAISSYSGTY